MASVLSHGSSTTDRFGSGYDAPARLRVVRLIRNSRCRGFDGRGHRDDRRNRGPFNSSSDIKGK